MSIDRLSSGNPAIGIRLPRKKARKPPVLLELPQIRAMLEIVPEPTRSFVTLIVFGSMRVGEVIALRWKRITSDRISIVERAYDGEFDDVKTDAGERDVPFNTAGANASALRQTWERSKFRGPEDLVFANRAGKPLDTHNLLHRHIKPAALKLGLPRTVDFRGFRTMHASLMRRTGARPEVARDNMGHSEIGMTLDGYAQQGCVRCRCGGVCRAGSETTRRTLKLKKKRKWEMLNGCPFLGAPKANRPRGQLSN